MVLGTRINLNTFFLLISFFRLLHSIPHPLLRARIHYFGLTQNLGGSLLIRLTWQFRMILSCMMTGFGTWFGVGRAPKVCGFSYGKCFTISWKPRPNWLVVTSLYQPPMTGVGLWLRMLFMPCGTVPWLSGFGSWFFQKTNDSISSICRFGNDLVGMWGLLEG